MAKQSFNILRDKIMLHIIALNAQNQELKIKIKKKLKLPIVEFFTKEHSKL